MIVKTNPLDNNSPTLIILNEPTYEEFMIHNFTSQEISFAKIDHSSKKLLSEHTPIAKEAYQTFVWDNRDKLIKRLQIKVKDQVGTLSLDQQTTETKKRSEKSG